MRPHARACTRIGGWVLLAAAATAAGGCGTGGRMTVEQTGGRRQVFVEEFGVAHGREDQNLPGQDEDRRHRGNFVFVAPNHDVVLFAERPGADGEFTQYLRFRTLWPYLPGLSHTDPAQINCMVDYVLVGPRGALLYQGCGLLHVVPKGGRFDCLLKSAHLALRGRDGEAQDVLGICELRGKFSASADRSEHTYYVRRFERVVENLKARGTEAQN